jgi:hypothetical protein
MLPVPTVDYLAQFTGRDVATYTAYADQALIQATLMFSTVTQLEDLPADPDKAALAINGILQMADRIYLEQPYAAIQATPFNAETIGSYSYSKGYNSLLVRSHAQQNSELTGLFWWDLAVEELSQVDRSLVTSGSVSAMEGEDIYRVPDGGLRVLSPGDIEVGDPLRVDNVELRPRPALG